MNLHQLITHVFADVGVISFVTLMRAVAASVWGIAIWRIWKARHSPVANMAMTAALALVGAEFTLIYHQHFSPNTLAFFVTSAQVAMAIAVMRIFNWLSHHTVANEVSKVKLRRTENCLLTFLESFIAIVVVGAMYFIFTWIESGL